jgi:hypothetical protein
MFLRFYIVGKSGLVLGWDFLGLILYFLTVFLGYLVDLLVMVL